MTQTNLWVCTARSARLRALRKLAATMLLSMGIVGFAGLAPQTAQAQLQIDITQGVIEPLPIAVVDFFSEDSGLGETGNNIATVIRNNLVRSGLFRAIREDAFIQTAQSLAVQPNYSDWRAINAEGLVFGRLAMERDGRLRVEFRLWDVVAQQQMTGLVYHTRPDNWRRVHHIISDAIFKRITGEDGYFDTRIVYVSESGPGQRRIKRLAIMDQDGANHKFLTDGRSLVLTPRFSPSTQEITYLSYFNNRPRVYLFNIDTGQQELVGDFPGMTFAPRFSPDGNGVILSQAIGGNTEIFSMDLRTRKKTKLTNHPSIDTAPSYSPDGQFVTFESDRSGRQQIYVMEANGRGVQRISFGDGGYGTPVWSPRGDLIAFTRQHRGQFFIGVMRPDGSQEKTLATGYLVESPTWSPNGRFVIFFRQKRQNSQGIAKTNLFMVDLTGRNERQIVTPTDASDPAWSPLIP